MKYLSALLSAFLCILSTHATVIIPGDMVNPDTSFAFPLLEQISFDPIAQTMYVAAKDPVLIANSQAYAVSALLKNYSVFIPLLSTKASINGTVEINPLFGNAIAHIGLASLQTQAETRFVPIVVPQSTPGTAYAILNFAALTRGVTALLPTGPLEDALQGTDTQIVDLVPTQNGFLAAVVDQEIPFGDPASNAALIGRSFYQDQSSGILSFNPSFFIPYNNSIPALKLTVSPVMDPLMIAPALISDLAMGGAVYVGVTLTTPGRAVTLFDQEIAPAAAFDTDRIIGSTTQNVAAYSLATVHTTTNLVYLAALSDLNSPVTTRTNVYAMPVVNNMSSSSTGKLAKVDQLPENIFAPFYPYPYQGSTLSDPAVLPADLYASTDTRAQVGGGPLTNFTINRIFTQQDAVFAQATYSRLGVGTSGLFYSQALFDTYGRIQRWTRWQRKTLDAEFLFAGLNPYTGNYFGIPAATSQSVVQTEWSINQSLMAPGFQGSLNQTPLTCGGIQGLIDIPDNHQGVGATHPSFFMQVGYNTVSVQQTAAANDVLVATPFGTFTSTAGSMQNFTAPVGGCIWSGGALDKAGALITGELAYTVDLLGIPTDAWIVAAGTGGVFILAKPDGTGTGSTGLRDGFAGLDQTMRWQPLGAYTNVKKVCVDDNLLYVLTNDRFERIELSPAQIALGTNCATTSLATTAQFNTQPFPSFADALASGDFALLATSTGLFRVGNGVSIRSAPNPQACHWERINLPEGVTPVVFLAPITHTGVSSDLCKEGGMATNPPNLPTGNVTVLAASFGTHQGMLYRFTCYDAVTHPVSNDTFQAIPTFFVKDTPSYFWDTKSGRLTVASDTERLSVATDGASWYLNAVFSTGLVYRGMLELLPAYIKSGVPSLIFPFVSALATQNLHETIGPATFISGPGLWAVSSPLGTYTLR